MTQPLDIVIRALEPDDYSDLMAIFSGPQVLYGSLDLPYPPLDVWRRRTETTETDLPRLVAAVEDMVVGFAELDIGEGRRRHTGFIDMAVRDDYQGRGVGGALLGAIIDLGERWYGLTRLEALVYTDNKPALALYKRFDFLVEGTLRGYALRDGTYCDVYSLARLGPALKAS